MIKEEVDSSKVKKSLSGKPLQLVSYTEKTKNKDAWAKATINYFLDRASFNGVPKNFHDAGITSKGQLYDFYNNDIPETAFNYVTNPLKSTDPKFQAFPAKIRPYNIMRPNLDLLMGEWNKRPFIYDVVNMDGEDAHNSFEAHKTKMYKDNVIQRFVNNYNELHGSEEQPVPSEEIPDPRTLISTVNLNYKDAKALQGYKALRVIEEENKVRELWRTLFKDWTLAGEVFTLKMSLHGSIEYLRLSPQWAITDESVPYGEDGDFGLAKFRMSTSQLVDFFYDKLSKEQIKDLENKEGNSYSSRLYNFFNTKNKGSDHQHEVCYVCWKAKQTIGFLSYIDPLTGEQEYDIVDESYKVDEEAGEEIEWLHVNEVWEGWRVNDDFFVGIGPVQAQRNEMNNFSACKLPINSKKFSDLEANNVSIAFLSIPYQLLYIILMYRMELTIAKSKGKIVLLDANVIPNEEEGGEEAFFWYSEAMGYALVHRDQDGVDRSWNQYQVLDLSLFQHIQELMTIMEYVKGQLEELLGITRQRKGQINSSDGLGTSEQAIYRGNVISDILFTGFEEFLERELQGLLDCSKFAWADGKKGMWRNDDGRREMFALDPETYTTTDYGVFAQNMSKYIEKFNMIKQNVNAIAQRKDVKASTIIELVSAESLVELKALVKKAEAVEQEIIEKTSENEQAAQAEMQKAQQEWEYFMHTLDLDKIEREWDRKDNNEYIKASLDKDPGAGMDSYTGEVEKAATERLKLREEARQADNQNRLEREWMAIEEKKIKSNERINKQKVAAMKKKATSSK